MPRTYLNRLGAAAIACVALGTAPTGAQAHGLTCHKAPGLPSMPATVFADWTTEMGCATPRPVAGFDDASRARPARTASASRPASRRSPSRAPRGGSRFEQVGHEPLFNRGMNAALAVHGDFVYVGSRTDGGHGDQPHGGIQVVDVSSPSRPRTVGRPIDAEPGASSRELRVWRSKDVLIVLHTNCGGGPLLHHCTAPSVSNIRFYDIAGEAAAKPRLLQELKVDTHEFFLWEDPQDPDRALLFGGSAGSVCRLRGGAPSCPFAVWDISGVREGRAPTTLYSGSHGYTDVPAGDGEAAKPGGGLHSLSVSNDGTRAYWALLSGGFAVVDTSEFAAGAPNPKPHAITRNKRRPVWPGPGAHSAVKLWGRDYAYVSDEVYGRATSSDHGCPWGWARMVDISDAAAPVVRAEYRLPENNPASCPQYDPERTSFSAHNPTVTPNMVLTTWHSGGLQAIGVDDPRRPSQLAEWKPKPLREVLLEDPRLSSDPETGRGEKVVMWSFPVIQDGLIYVVDLRNGLYILRYEGAFEAEVSETSFLEGNSNQGDARRFGRTEQPAAGRG